MGKINMGKINIEYYIIVLQNITFGVNWAKCRRAFVVLFLITCESIIVSEFSIKNYSA